MQYRKFGSTDFMVSDFGLGNMRLPTTKNEQGETVIDRPKAIELIRYAIDHGVNYLDTAYVYHNQESEVVVGLALQDGYRERVKIATKLPGHKAASIAEMEETLQTSMDRLQVDYIDYYLLHGINRGGWQRFRDAGALEFLTNAKACGKIKNACFSFHGEYDEFVEIIDAYPWDMCQIQLNYLDIDNQAGVKGMQYAAEKGIGVVIMEPLRGGKLANIPADVQAIFDASPTKYTPAEWAFRWLYSQKGVATILSGTSTMEQMVDSLRIFEKSAIGAMTAEEEAVVLQAKAAYEKRIGISCTNCRYCMPCPNGVAIPEIFAIYNEAFMYDDLNSHSGSYGRLKESETDASKCIDRKSVV